MADIPVIDFGKCGLAVDSIDPKECRTTGQAIYNAFATIGFVYLKNTGITQGDVDRVNSITDKFYKLESTVKEKYSRLPNNYGYIGMGVESINPKRPGDYKEAFNVLGDAILDENTKWPDAHVQGFSTELIGFCQLCRRLSDRLLEVLSSGMELKDLGYFQKCHSRLNGKDNFTTLRSLYYPPIPEDADIKPEQIRLGEHADYGSFTLLFQDNVGGLQVESYKGEYIDASPIPDTVVVNIGDILQFWTEGRLMSTRHRVLMPSNKSAMNAERRSLAYFVHPDHEVMLSGIKYGASTQEHHTKIKPEYREPVTAFEHVTRRFNKSYIN